MISGQQINRARLDCALCGEEWEGLGRSLSKRFKRQATRVGKFTHRVTYEAAPKVGKVIGYVAPIAGAVVGTVVGIGPTAGAAAGTVVGSAAAGASQHGNRKKKFRTGTRFLKYGGAVTAAAGVTELTSLAPGPLNIGRGAPAQEPLDFGQNLTTEEAPAGGGGGGWFSDIFGAGTKAASSFMSRQRQAAGERITEGITAPFDINAPGGEGGAPGAPGGAGAPGSFGTPGSAHGKPLETQHLIIGGIVLAGILFLIKRKH